MTSRLNARPGCTQSKKHKTTKHTRLREKSGANLWVSHSLTSWPSREPQRESISTRAGRKLLPQHVHIFKAQDARKAQPTRTWGEAAPAPLAQSGSGEQTRRASCSALCSPGCKPLAHDHNTASQAEAGERGRPSARRISHRCAIPRVGKRSQTPSSDVPLSPSKKLRL